ncbi:P-loop containing nucleoside triphosphate hydrolase protein [Aspergillus avenaceus]|uniref:P-loop containing nucleoside triphosphate hydrolase protein n=1 Tax=Aspergillus avenaceus TaxID=36643 RepID=A0A5N6U574_ASPAV|nr:P-loop containing nucleoside triphosphate hydrolase protein [Aspergillus avenaceus]
MGGLSHLEHRRSPRPSSILTLYLLAAAPLNAARARTLWYMPSTDRVFISFTVTAGLMVIALGLELAPKDGLIKEGIVGKPSSEERRGIVERSLLTWIVPVFAHGYRHTFTSATMPLVDPRLTTCRLKETAITDLDKSLVYGLVELHWRDLLAPVLPRACYLGLTLAQAFLVERATALVSNSEATQRAKNAVVGAYVLVYLGLAVTYSLYRQNAVRAAVAMRASLTDFVFQRLSHLDSAVELAGSATTLVSADIERIQFGMREIHEVWANLIATVIALYLIERSIGVAMVTALGISIVCMAGVLLVSVAGSQAQKQWFEATEARVAQVVKILAEFKSIKMMGYTAGLLRSLTAARLHEVRRSQKFRAFVIVVATLAQAATALVPALGVATYVLLHNSGDGQVMSASLAFGTLTLFTILTSSIGQLFDSVFGTVTAFGCISRVQDTCTKHYRVDPRQTSNPGETPHTSVAMNHARAKYDESGHDVIQNANFDIKPGMIVRVVGPIASGKSTLLKMILGEVRYCAGEVTVSDKIIGYCDQNPWLNNVSIRDNITGPAPFDPERYAEAIRICALETDLETMPGGDACLCFGNGTTLSGGQKARIGLARAIYARPRILVLDDCLSGLDANTEHLVLENLVGVRGFLKEHSITTFLVSSSRKPLPRSIATLTLEPDGPVLTEGRSSHQQHVPSALIHDSKTAQGAHGGEFGDEKETDTRLSIEENGDALEGYQQSGELALYVVFVKVAGAFGLMIFVFLLAIFIVGITYPQIYLDTWVTRAPAEQHRSIYILTGIYLGLSGVALCAFSAACVLFTLGIAPRISITFHSLLAKALLSAPLSLLATTDRGSITNRFAQDLAIIDQEVPLAFIGTVLVFLQLLAGCVTLIIGSHYAGIAIPFLLGVVYCIQSAYLPTSSQLRLLDLEAKAPIVSLFVRSVEGLATIRAFGWLNHTQIQSRRYVIASQVPFYLLATAQNMLSLVLDLVTAALAIIVISISAVSHDNGLGLALYSIVGLGTSTKLLISQWTELETSLGAMRRINNFAENTPSEVSSYRSTAPPHGWPSKGTVDFRDVSLAYSETMPPVISKLNLKIEAGWKVGICGRTGSGKSTLVSSILGLVHIRQGSIMIDDQNMSVLEPEALRSSITVVPQNAVLLPVDVRTNLTLGAVDPPSDERIIALLEEYGLYERFRKREGLDTLMVDDLLSQGERQIFCIVRAILHKSHLVLLDEPTSRADSSTQEIIDSAVLKGFDGSTVLYVAHRLEILTQFDRVLVMDKGRIAEFGDPRELLEMPGSLFASTFSKAIARISSPKSE